MAPFHRRLVNKARSLEDYLLVNNNKLEVFVCPPDHTRRMFPSLLIDVAELESEAQYFILMEMFLAANSRYKFDSTKWVPYAKSEAELPAGSRVFVHPDSPSTGAHWMCQPISFQKVKLTNSSMSLTGHILLASMQKYVPKIHIVKASDILTIRWSPTATFLFPETEFIAVTAYQNELITKLKIDYNPFAKGFRDTGKSRCKRKSLLQDDDGVCCKHARFQQSCSSSVDDSGRLSLGSSSPAAEDVPAAPHEPLEHHLVPHIPWDSYSVCNAYLPHPLHDSIHPMWKYPYLMPPNPLLFLPFPYHPSLLRQQLLPLEEEPHLIDLSCKTGLADKPS